jgi:hypothetical protein
MVWSGKSFGLYRPIWREQSLRMCLPTSHNPAIGAKKGTLEDIRNITCMSANLLTME